MKRTLFTVMIALAVLTGAYSIAGAADGVHTSYRTGYSGGCGSSAACHSVTKGSFLPSTLDTTAAPNEKDYTNFCLACHNAAGEAHNKSAGSPSSNVYKGSTTILGNSGDSHSWNGVNHNAGTRTPTIAGFKTNFANATGAGTMFMPGGRVACQTCHNAMTKASTVEKIENWSAGSTSDNLNYTFGYTSTKQYLAQHIRVYRSSSQVVTRPTSTRVKELAALGIEIVSPSEYTYNSANATVTFSASQSGKWINVEILQPYLRVDNTANAMCLDCHNDRISSGVSHAPGTGASNGHPVAVNYGHSSGLNDTLKSSATGNVYMESVSGSQKVLCTSCHDPHNAASKNGQIMREADDQTLCGDCHKTKLSGYSTAGSVNIHNGSKHTAATVCVDCHTTHGSNNIMLIKNVINGKTINFQNFSNANSFGNDTGSSLCEACHSATSYHLASGGGTGHNTGKNCLGCHKHSNGFEPLGGCTTCHGQPPTSGSIPTGWAGDGDKHSVHMAYIMSKFPSITRNEDTCVCCHGSSIPRNDHNTGKDNAGIDVSSATYWNGGTFSDGGTIGKSNTADDSCTNVACHSTTGTRVWGGSGPATCDTCHPYPGSATNDWTGYNGHTVRKDGTTVTHMMSTGYNAATDTYAAMVADSTRCGKCHPNVPSNHQNGTINLSPGAYACGGANITIHQTVTRSNVTCDAAVCHNTRTTPNWW